MNCPNCNEPIETGSAFCGNCGQALSPASTSSQSPPALPNNSAELFFPVSTTADAASRMPGYAIPSASQQRNHLRATMSLVLGLLGIAGAVFIPVAGLVLGIIGIVLATMSMRSIKHSLSRAGLIASIIAVLVGLAAWAYAISNNAKQIRNTSNNIVATNNAPIHSAISLTTPCYLINFVSKLNIENPSDSCNMNAFNAGSFSQSTDAYKIYAINSSVSAKSFAGLAKKAIETDVKQSLPGFTITKETVGQFAASQAYFVTASNSLGVSVIEAAALHQTSHGENFFVFVHAVNGTAVDLLDLQLGWQWQ